MTDEDSPMSGRFALLCFRFAASLRMPATERNGKSVRGREQGVNLTEARDGCGSTVRRCLLRSLCPALRKEVRALSVTLFQM